MKYLLILIFILIPTVSGSNIDINHQKKNNESYKVASIISYSLEKHIDEKEIRDRTPFIKSVVHKLSHRYYFMNYSFNDSSITLQRKAFEIKERIEKFNPNVVTIYGISAFEYVYLKYILNSDINSIFYCIPDYWLSEVIQKYNLTSNPKFKGVIQNSNLEELMSFFNVRNIKFDRIVLIKNRRSHEDALFNKVKLTAENHGLESELLKVDTENELKIALKNLNEKPKSLIIFALPFLVDSNGKTLSDYFLAKIIEKYNKNNVEVSMIRNLSRYGVAISFVGYINQDSVVSPYAPCNVLFHKIYFNEKIDNSIILLDNKIVVNSDRLYKLDLNKSLETTSDISAIF